MSTPAAAKGTTGETIAEPDWHRVIPIFAATFAVVYLCAVEANWALVTYHPKIGEWEWLTRPSKSGPAMHWFGWLGTATLVSTSVSLLALPLVKRWSPPLWIGWAVPLAVMAAFVYVLRNFFLR
jgi:hypothetical protein